LISITWVHYPRLELEFGGKNSERDNEIIEVAEFIGIKSYKAKGKRLSTYQVKDVRELEPIVKDEDEHEPVLEEDVEPDKAIFEDVPFEINRVDKADEEDTSQMSLF